MKNHLVRCGRWIAPAIISSMMIGPVGCSGAGTDDREAPSTQASAKYDGETLFRGVVLMQGPAAAIVANGSKATSEEPGLPAIVAARVSTQIEQLRRDGKTVAADALEIERDRLLRGEITEAELRDRIARGVDPALVASFADRLVAHLRATDPAYFDGFAVELYSGDHLRVRAALEDAARRVTSYGVSAAEGGGAGVGDEKCVLIMIAAIAFIAAAVQFVWHWDHGTDPQSALRRDESVQRIVTALGR